MSDETENATKDDELPAWQQKQMRAAWEKWNSGAMNGGPATTPTAALVEEAKRREKDLAMWTIDESWRRDSMYDLLQFFRKLIKAHEQAEAERDAQRAEVLRLTRERDAARAEVQTLLWIKSASVKLLDTLQGIRWMEPHEPDDERVIAATRAWVEAAGLTMHAELLKTIEELRALGFGLGCMLTNSREETEWQVEETRTLRREVRELSERLAGMPMPEDDDPAGKHLMSLINRRRELYQRVDELTATRDLLTEENARLQARVATLELLRRGGK